jgi:hypothetical protein
MKICSSELTARIVTPNPVDRWQQWSYEWRRLSDNSLAGTSETLAVAALAWLVR